MEKRLNHKEKFIGSKLSYVTLKVRPFFSLDFVNLSEVKIRIRIHQIFRWLHKNLLKYVTDHEHIS